MKLPALYLFLIICLSSMNALANDCPDCRRGWVMGKCENKALPEDFWESQKLYGECLQKELNLAPGENYFEDKKNPQKEWIQAQKNCGHLLPDYGRQFDFSDGKTMTSSLEAGIHSVLTCNRFHRRYEKAAYLFEATYDCARTPVYNDDNEKRYPSSLNIRMYYDGKEKELVKEWTVNSPTYSWNLLTNLMFEHQGRAIGYKPALMRQDIPITTLLDAFEKVPQTCTITPEKDPIAYNSDMTIEISGFKDTAGDQSREFNRVLVVVESGSITNGARPEGMDKDNAAVFQVGNGRINVAYKAPATSVYPFETIKVFHCHNILKQSVWPLEKTDISSKVISQEQVMFKLPGVSAAMKISYKNQRREDRVISDRNEVHNNWNEGRSCAVLFQLEKEPRLSKEVDPKTRELSVTRYRYRIKHLSLIDARHTGSGSTNTDISGVQVSSNSRLTAGGATIRLEQPGSMIKMDVDPATGKISTIIFPNLLLMYQTTLKTQGTKKSGTKTYPIDQSFDQQIEWSVGPDFADDGAGTCFQVNGGNEKTLFTGGCKKEKKGRYSNEFFSSSWTFSINPDE